jgi:hypothetical protein
MKRWSAGARWRPARREPRNRRCWCEPGKPGKCWEKSVKEPKPSITSSRAAAIRSARWARSSASISTSARAPSSAGSTTSPTCASSIRRRATSARRHSTSASAGATARISARWKTVCRTSSISSSPRPRATARDLRRGAREPAQGAGFTRSTITDLVRELEKDFGQGAVVARPAGVRRQLRALPFQRQGAVRRRRFPRHRRKPPVCAPTGWATTRPFRSPKSAPSRCRSLHSNHMRGHVWEEFANEDYHARARRIRLWLDPHDGGRGYYRNVSLLNLWAHAPFMHNNAVGPELCGWDGDASQSLRALPLQLRRHQPAGQPAAGHRQTARLLDLRPLGRGPLQALRRLDAGSAEPRAKRIPKATKVDQDIVLDIGPRIFDGKEERNA